MYRPEWAKWAKCGHVSGALKKRKVGREETELADLVFSDQGFKIYIYVFY